MIEHAFTDVIKEILKKKFKENGLSILENSELLQYINLKTRAANRGSKSRGRSALPFSIL